MGIERRSAIVRVLGIGLVLPDPRPVMVEPPTGIALRRGPAYVRPIPPDLGALSAGLARRLGRSQRMMVAAAAQAVGQSPIALEPKDSVAVAVGTGLGTVADTTDFLENMVRLDEREPKPAKFINSVHNSAAANVAIAFGFMGENRTFIHRGISFELALWGAARLLQSGRASFALVGGVDETSPYVVTVGREKGLWRDTTDRLTPMAGKRAKGTLPGEGSGAVLLCGDVAAVPTGSWPTISGVRVRPLSAPGIRQLDVSAEVEFMKVSAAAADRTLEDVDLFLFGANADCMVDRVYLRVAEALEPFVRRDARIAVFKGACGEFCTSSAVGTALAAQTVRDGNLAAQIEMVRGPHAGVGISTAVVYSLPQLAYHSVCTVTV
jgi:3-oxoacyl-[acyl-carrier-protein] synthase II